MVRIFYVICPNCRRKQKTWTTKINPIGNTKQCVYCGKRFKIRRENLCY